MPPNAQFPHTRVVAHPNWSNYSGTISGRKIPIFCSLEGGADVSIMKKHGDAIRAIVRHCFNQNTKLRVLGSTWSFSSVVEPDQVALDPSAMTFRHRVTPDQLSAAYAPRSAEGYVPYYFQGGTGIASINERLGNDGLALQTSGGGNGHRIGGCIATGTHGSAIGIGALHDTVLALHLVTGPDSAVLVQPGTDGIDAPFTPELAQWLQQVTGIPTRNIANDTLFRAAQVSLGSLGVVFGVIVEATPLYHFRIRRARAKITSDVMWDAIKTLDTSALHPTIAQKPYHFEVILHPYPDIDREMMFATLMWKEDPAGIPFRNPLPGFPRVSSDTMGLISRLTTLNNALLAGLTRQALQTQILEQLRGDNVPIDRDGFAFPGEVFGPTTLPGGSGASTEIVVDHQNAEKALKLILRVLDEQATKGRSFLGCVAARFVPKTNALLGMNKASMNCFIELPSVRNDNVIRIYKAIWSELDAKGVSFACHWGQMGGFKPERVRKYYGPDFAAWSAARSQLLNANPTALHVFGAAILAKVGL